MKRSTEQRTVRSFVRRMPKINLQPAYQRGGVWTKKQKQLLIDSILTDLDIPKIYLNELNDGGFEEEAVDGQQRLTAITEYYSNEFPLSKSIMDVGDVSVKGKRFDELAEDLKDKFESYELTVVILRNAEQVEVEEMFLRLQNGTSLNAAEKRNAMRGNMSVFIKKMAKHSFFQSCGFKNNRYTFDSLAAQMTRLASAKDGKSDVGNTELVKLYEKNIELDLKGALAKKVESTLNYLHEVFPEKTPELTKLTTVTLFSIALNLRENYSLKDMKKEFATIFIDFGNDLRNDNKKRNGERNEEYERYKNACDKSTTSSKSIGDRFNILLSYFLNAEPDLPLLDNRRSFTEEQRLEIYRRDKQTCQLKIKCGGRLCDWDDWHADHIEPWNKGGVTTINNGQVACPECNLSKGG